MESPSPALHRVGGSIALDLANTISWRGTAREVDHLASAQAIMGWFRETGLPMPNAAPDTLLADTQDLRRAIFAAGSAFAQGDPADDPMLTIRDFAARTLSAARMPGHPARLAFAPADAIIGPLAWAALDLFRGPETARLKQCPAEGCRWLFIDRTRNGSRRWCEMSTCGNRAKKMRGPSDLS